MSCFPVLPSVFRCSASVRVYVYVYVHEPKIARINDHLCFLFLLLSFFSIPFSLSPPFLFLV